MNQDTQPHAPGKSQKGHDAKSLRSFEAAEFLRREFGIPTQATPWILYSAAYRPAPAQCVEVDDPFTGAKVVQAVAWSTEDVLTAGRCFMTECAKSSATLWSHPKVAGRFKLRAPPDQVFADLDRACVEPRSRVGRKVPSINLRRVSPDDLADALGFADDWAEGKLSQPSLSESEIGMLAHLRYGLPRSAVFTLLHFMPYKPEPVAWCRPFRARSVLVGSAWRPQDAHRAVLALLAECKPDKGGFWTHPRVVKERFRLRPEGRKVAMPVEPPRRRRNGLVGVKLAKWS